MKATAKRLTIGVFVAALSFAMLAGSVRAQQPDPEAVKAAEDLLAVVSDDIIKQLTSQMLAQAWPTIQTQLGGSMDENGLQQIREEFERIAGAFTREAMKAAPPIYAKHLTAVELREIAAFYKTPAGAKALTVMPQVMADFYASALLPKMPELEAELRTAIMAIITQQTNVKKP
ncbi:MAG: DUF2059 domain-containing protein [Pseudorhodoplanes sp.]